MGREDSKYAFLSIVFNGDYFLQEMLESIYPHASKIIVVEGPVKYWAAQGYRQSTDKTVDILKQFPDPEGKLIKTRRFEWRDKKTMYNAAMTLVPDDTDYIWAVDSDEFYKQDDIMQVKELVAENDYDSVAFCTYAFFAGFTHYAQGFDEELEVHRIKRFYPGARFLLHRPPTILNPETNIPWRECKHLGYKTLDEMGIRMFHYNCVFPKQVQEKARFYYNRRPKQMIPNYFEDVYLPWLEGDDNQRAEVERINEGVHSFRPLHRVPSFTKRFTDRHPEIIEKNRRRYQLEILFQLALHQMRTSRNRNATNVYW